VTSTRRCGDPGGQSVRFDQPIQNLLHHGKIVLTDVGERELHILQLGYAQDVGHEALGEAAMRRLDQVVEVTAGRSIKGVYLQDEPDGPRPIGYLRIKDLSQGRISRPTRSHTAALEAPVADASSCAVRSTTSSVA